MASKSKLDSVATAYARSVLELADESGVADAVGEELTQIAGILKENPDLETFLSNPSVSVESHQAFVAKVFGGRVHPLISSLLGVMAEKGRLALLSLLIPAYRKLLHDRLGNVDVDLTVARELTAEQVEQATVAISQALGKKAIVRPKVDESILGGVVVRVGDRLLDASVRSQLELMRQRLLAAAPR